MYCRLKAKVVVGQFRIVADERSGMSRPQLWIGLVELRPLRKGHRNPAFTNILTWASDSESFRAKAETIAAELDMYVIGVENEEPLDARRERSKLTEEVEDMLSRASSNPNAIIYGTFHTFPG